MKDWINILDYGAVGDGVHDDSAAIIAAITAANLGTSRTVYFPPTAKSYYVSSLSLPVVYPWIKLYLDGTIRTNSTISVPSWYSIHGDSSGPAPQFSFDSGTWILPLNLTSTEPVVHIIGGHVNIENISIEEVGGNKDGILVGPSVCCVTLTNVSSQLDRENLGGSALHIVGGFGYIIEKGYYTSPAGRNSPSIRFDVDESRCEGSGIARMHDVVIAGHGVEMNFPCGGAGPFTFENILYESCEDSFLTINGGDFVEIFGTYLKDIQMSDCDGPPYPSIVTNHAKRVDGMQIFASWVGGAGSAFISGDPVRGLEIWSPWNFPVGQTSEYILHLPTAIVSTMPLVTPSTTLPLPIEPSPPSHTRFFRIPPEEPK